MFVENLTLTNEWQNIASVNTGDSFLIQNCSNDVVYYIVSDVEPNVNVGGILMPYQQLGFKKIAGDLYMKDKNSVNNYVHIEKVEE